MGVSNKGGVAEKNSDLYEGSREVMKLTWFVALLQCHFNDISMTRFSDINDTGNEL